MLHRCGVEDEKIDQYINLQYLDHFRDFPALCTLGDTVASLAKPILIDMEKTIHRLEKKREWEQKQQKKIDEKTVPEEKRDFEEIPFAQEHEQRYDNRDLDELIAGVAQQVHANLPNGGKDNGTERHEGVSITTATGGITQEPREDGRVSFKEKLAEMKGIKEESVPTVIPNPVIMKKADVLE